MRELILILLLILSGCSSTYSSLDGLLPTRDEGKLYHKTVDDVLKHYFTEEAYWKISKIPMVDSWSVRPYAAGVNFWASCAGLVTGIGPGRKIVMSKEDLKEFGVRAIIHEYIHHLDDMDREGEGEWIDHEEFVAAYSMLPADKQYRGVLIYTERRANDWFTDWFGVGEYAEHIAYSGSVVAMQSGPWYLKKAFRKMLRP